MFAFFFANMRKKEIVIEAERKLSHPRSIMVKRTNAGFMTKSGENQWVRLRGIHTAMKMFYQPPAKNAMRRSYSKGKKKDFLTDKEVDAKEDETIHEKGTTGGTKVHKEVEMFCNEREEFERRAKITRKYLQRMKEYRDGRRPKKPEPPAGLLHKYTLRLLDELFKHGLSPVRSEYKIFSPGAYATMIDIICVDTVGDICVIEVKTGYQHTLKTWTRRMNGILSPFLTNSQLSVAMLQSFIPSCTLEFEYGIKAKSFVAVVNDDGARLIKTSKELLENRRIIYDKILKKLKV